MESDNPLPILPANGPDDLYLTGPNSHHIWQKSQATRYLIGRLNNIGFYLWINWYKTQIFKNIQMQNLIVLCAVYISGEKSNENYTHECCTSAGNDSS